MWLWQYHSMASRWNGRHYAQALSVEWELLRGDWGLVWQPAPIRQLESASAYGPSVPCA